MLRLVAHDPPPVPPLPPTIRVTKALVYGSEDQLLTTMPVDGQRLIANDCATFTITVKASDRRSRRQRRRGKPVGSRMIERIDLIDNTGVVVYSHPVALELPGDCEAVLPITVMCRSAA